MERTERDVLEDLARQLDPKLSGKKLDAKVDELRAKFDEALSSDVSDVK